MSDIFEVAATGDWHVDDTANSTGINPATGINRAWESHLGVGANCVAEAINRDVKAFVVSGDNFANGRPHQEAVLRLADTLRPLVKAGIPLVLLGGNHELLQVPLSHRTATEVLGGLLTHDGEVHVVERESRLVNLSTGLQVAAMPWLSKTHILNEMGAGDLGPIEGDRKVAQFAIDELMKMTDKADHSAPLIFAAHATVDDVRIDSLAEGARRGSEVDMAHVFSEPIISRAGIEDSPVSYAALSHIHARQRIGTKCFYSGSPDRMTMTDADDPKSMNFVTISDDNSLVKVEQFDTGARPMHSISLEDRDAEDRLDALEHGALVRIELPAGESVVPESIRKMITAAGAVVTGTKTTPKERKKSKAITLPEKVSPSEALRSYLKKYDPDGVDTDYAVKLTTQLMEA